LLAWHWALHTAVFAGSSIDYSNSGGTLSGSNSGLSLGGSVLIAVIGNAGLITGFDLGSLSFETGALTSGSVQQGGTFAGAARRGFLLDAEKVGSALR